MAVLPRSRPPMSPKSIVYKAELQISDMDRHYYATHVLTLALHPSETMERLMTRLLAFAIFADERLEFGRGLSADDEPDLWRKELTGEIATWIELGQPDEQRLRKAAGRSREVIVVNYSGRPADVWWDKSKTALARIKGLSVLDIPAAVAQSMAALADRSMRVQCLIEDGELQLMLNGGTVVVHPQYRQQATGKY